MTGKHSASRIKVWPALKAAAAPYNKTLTTIGGALLLLAGACLPFSPGGAWWAITEAEWYAVAAAAGLTFPVWRVPNKDPRATHQDESTQPPDGGNFTPTQQAKLREARRRIEARKRKKGIR